MSAQQQLVGAAGIGLVVANVWTGPQRKSLAGVLGSSTAAVDTAAAHKTAKAIGGELLGVGALVLLAGASSSAGNAALIVLVALWVLWLTHRAAPFGTDKAGYPLYGPSVSQIQHK